jgi:hypothetical protein
MQAAAQASREPTKDILAIEWMPLAAAVKRLSFPLEKLFLDNVGRYAILRSKSRVRRKRRSTGKMRARKSKISTSRKAARARTSKLQQLLERLVR